MITISLPQHWLERCTSFGHQVVDGYQRGLKEASRTIAIRAMDSNAEAQAMARMCEVAFALWAKLEPEIALNWGGACDGGSDLVWRDQRWDIKSTGWHGRYLIWPVNKTELYGGKAFDNLALVKHRPPMFGLCGWVSKGEFWIFCKVASEGHKLLPGTWYMDQDDLHNLELL